MLLAVDIGNTNIHLGLWDGASWRLTWRARTVPEKMTDEYAVLLRNFLQSAAVEMAAVSGICLSSVVPALSATFQELARRYLQLEALTISSQSQLGIAVDIDIPEQAGADRLCNAVALAQCYGGPALSVDFGTSTNFDVISADNAYIGGVIAPGLRLTHDALVSRAAQLHKVELLPPPAAIGRNTIHAMQSGLFWGYVGMVNALVQRVVTQLAAPAAQVIATGGLAPLMKQHCDCIDHIAPELTLNGLRIVYERQS